MTFIFAGQPSKRRPFPIKTRVIWVSGIYIYRKIRYLYIISIAQSQKINKYIYIYIISFLVSGYSWMYPDPNVPRHRKSQNISPYITWVFMGKLSPRIPRLNTINTMGPTLLGVHPSLSLDCRTLGKALGFCSFASMAAFSQAILRFLPRQQRAMRTRKLSRGLPFWRRCADFGGGYFWVD